MLGSLICQSTMLRLFHVAMRLGMSAAARASVQRMDLHHRYTGQYCAATERV